MAENLFLAGGTSILAELPTLLTFKNGGNKITPKDIDTDELVNRLNEPITLENYVARQREIKQAEQLKIGRRALEADPEGVGGYNAFVNEPAEPIARATVDETANTVEFMADNARIQNNVDTVNGRARPLIDNDTQELLSRADAGARRELMRKVSQELGGKFELEVGGTKLTSKQVTEAVNSLYDATIAPVGKNFDDAVKQFRDLELKIGSLDDTVTGRGGRKILGKTIDRLRS